MMRAFVFILLAACGAKATPQPTEPKVTMVGDKCCCEFVTQGDIIKEDLRTPDQCTAEPSGKCILVNPARLTPHPCCPNATGERCGY